MRHLPLGSTGIRVPALGFGCMRLPTLGCADRIDEPATTRLLHDAIEKGATWVDTAWFYHGRSFTEPGESEPAVGRALSGGWRGRVQLATKLPQQLVRARPDMDRFLEQQLERLRTDHIDFYLLHSLDGEAWDRMRDLGVREFLEGAQRRGLVGRAAFSFHGHVDDFRRIVDEYDGWAFAQLQLNYVDTEFQAGMAGLRHALARNLGVVVMEPLKGGRLAGGLPPAARSVFDARPEGWSPAEWALRWLWNQPGVSMLLSGMNEASQLEENLRVADEAGTGALSPDQLAVYDAARAAMRGSFRADCTACRYCQPCPAGVQIPEVLAALNSSVLWKTTNAWFTGYARIAGKPDACTDCGKCEEACPQGLPIRALLKETSATFSQ